MSCQNDRKHYYTMSPQETQEQPTAAVTSGQVWQGLKDKTTSHGLPHIDNAAGRIKRSVWCIITLGCITMVTYTLEQITSKYISNDVYVVVNRYHVQQQKFPAVTLCNMNAFKKDSLAQSPTVSAILGTGSSTKKRRRKRAVVAPICAVDNLHAESGYCYALAHGTDKFSCSNGETECTGIGSDWEFAVIDTQAKFDFISNASASSIFSGAGSSEYWMNLQGTGPNWQWETNPAVDITFENWDSGEPGIVGIKCGYANAGDSHKWFSTSCNTQYTVLCQKLEIYTTATPSPTTVQESTSVSVTTTTTPETTVSESTTIPGASSASVTTNTASQPVHITTVSEPTTIPVTPSASVTISTPPSPVPITTVTTTTTTPAVISVYNPPSTPAPVPLAGSKFPERVEATEQFSAEEKTFEILADIPEEEKRSLGYTSDEFIIDCQYAGYKCTGQDFSYFYNYIHGNCYTFNSGWNESLAIQYSMQLGPRYGLKVVVNINQDQYIEHLSDAAGVRLVIHSQDKMPFPADEGTMARTGYATLIGLERVSIQKKGPPYTKCLKSDVIDLTQNVYEEHYNVKYSTLACYKTCYQRNVISNCGCADVSIPSYGQAFNYVNVSACNTSDIVQDDCKYEITQLYSNNQLICNCQDPCEEDFYVPESSEMRWPSDKFQDSFKTTHASSIPNIVASNDTEKLRDNLAKIEVFFKAFDYEVIKEVPAYTEIPFCTDIGGTMGLWIGWSIITAFEFIEFFLDLIILALTQFKSGKVKIAPAPEKAKVSDSKVFIKSKRTPTLVSEAEANDKVA